MKDSASLAAQDGMHTLLLALLVSQPPLAPSSQDQPSTEVVYARRTVVDFSSVTISGEVERPAGAYTIVKRKPRFKTLIRVRGGFLPEIVRSADKL